MTEGNTDIILNPNLTADPARLNGDTSHIFSVSLRGWLAIMIVGTLCGITIWLHTDKVVNDFILLAGGAISFYFGQGSKK